VRGEAQDMVSVDGERDGRTGIRSPASMANRSDRCSQPRKRWPTRRVAVDLQDIGTRYYTFVWTMALSMQAAARAGVAVVVLDRPIPSAAARLKAEKSNRAMILSWAWRRCRCATA